MEYRLVQTAVDKILSESKTENGFFGWANPASNLSRTVTAQVIITLSKCSEFETDIKRRTNILSAIEKGFFYLKQSIEKGNCELPTFTFTLMAHLEHYERYSSTYIFDIDLINTCISEMRGNNNDFYYEPEKAYQYSNSIDRKYFPTYLALQAYLRLLNFLEKNPSVHVYNLTINNLLTEIDNCFIYIYEKLKKKIAIIDQLTFIKNAEYLSIGIQISKSYEDYSSKYNRIPNISNTQFNLDTAINYFSDRLQTDVFTNWHICIDRTPFELIYISNLVSGLLKCRGKLSEKGFKLLYQLAFFICTDDRIQDKDVNGNILSTKITKSPVWGTAHSLNAILKLEFSIHELEWINANLKGPTAIHTAAVPPIPLFDFSDYLKSTLSRIVIPIFTGLASSLIFSKYLSDKAHMVNYFSASLILLFASASLYFIPIFLFNLLAKSFSFFERHEKKLATIGYLIMIAAYTIMIYHYTFNNK